MLFGAIGLGFFAYRKKQKAVVPLSVGVALFIYHSLCYAERLDAGSRRCGFGGDTVFYKNLRIVKEL